jgi:hypothetical protein
MQIGRSGQAHFIIQKKAVLLIDCTLEKASVRYLG